MAKIKIHVGKGVHRPGGEAAGKAARVRVALQALKQAMGDFDDIGVQPPAVRPKLKERKAIKKAVRAFYRSPKTLGRT